MKLATRPIIIYTYIYIGKELTHSCEKLTAKFKDEDSSSKLIACRQNRQNILVEDVLFFTGSQRVVNFVVLYFEGIVTFYLKNINKIFKNSKT